MNEGKGTMENLRGKMNGDVQNLEAKMADVLKKRRASNDAWRLK